MRKTGSKQMMQNPLEVHPTGLRTSRLEANEGVNTAGELKAGSSSIGTERKNNVSFFK